MAALDLHEQEQVDALKAWWKENGRLLLLAVVSAAVVLGGVFGWRYLQGQRQAEAATLFGEVLKQVGSHDPKRVEDAAAQVVSRHASSIYAVRAQLLAAQTNIEAKNTSAAASELQWVIDHAGDEGIQDVARLKLAAMRLDEKKYDDALKLLDAAHPESFNGLYYDLKGDVYDAQGKKDQARAAYQQALDKLAPTDNYRNIVQMKLDGIGGGAQPGAAANAPAGGSK